MSAALLAGGPELHADNKVIVAIARPVKSLLGDIARLFSDR
jgi:hypothetical protein